MIHLSALIDSVIDKRKECLNGKCMTKQNIIY